MRAPPVRPMPNRAQTATPTLSGRLSPAESIHSARTRTPKRKIHGDIESDGGEETNINVVVRCRGRNDREVRENSGVVVSTDGIKGTRVDLSMGANALSNKSYQFDKVFSPAADQGIIFDEVVAPILDEVLDGFNCTLFAYGQTGTGKTYTMSGDISDTLPIPEAAGIIPRVLHTLFAKLDDDQSGKSEHSVKCSFIELYNEELRDLLASDEGTKLKIFDEANKNGRTTTLVQGMEETHIKTAAKGIQLLRNGSHKRQVAATKCNDLSSRSHTVFTVTVYTKKVSDSGEDFVASGKLNLVDLAGSENIQRSGAENKRATEAGLINKSLLTLGRVINALVDKSSHIPYRESKLTRLLQDSLGGRTKTCIIATLSPAKSNLEETISTLDYAFRAKNIKNKPQLNPMMSKKTLLKEFTAEIEKLKSELIATRQRNGVYLTAENYEEITTESESRRILSNEQRDKIETLENHLRNKGNELFVLGSSFQLLKRDNDQIKTALESTKGVLERTEILLQHTKRSLVEEALLRKAHQDTEEKLAGVGGDLLGALETTTTHVDRLHSKLRRRSDLHSTNKLKWAESKGRLVTSTMDIEGRLNLLKNEQQNLVTALSERMQTFVSDELEELQSSQTFLQQKTDAFETSKEEVHAQTLKAKDEMNLVLEEIGTLREDVKEKVGAGLENLSAAAQRISAGIAIELDGFHAQLQESYVSLGREFKMLFEDVIRRMQDQQNEAERLRDEMRRANEAFVAAGRASQDQLKQAMDAEKETAAKDRASLLSQITSLVNNTAQAQETRMDGYLEMANKRLKLSEDEYEVAQQTYGSGMESWRVNSEALVDCSVKARDTIKAKLQGDWTLANDHTNKISATTDAVHGETVRIVDGQMAQMDKQLVALDEIIRRVRAQNEEHHLSHTASLDQLVGNVQLSYRNIAEHLEMSYSRTRSLDEDVQARANAACEALTSLGEEGELRGTIHALREIMADGDMVDYATTGETPAKTQYTYPTHLPRTESHETLLDRMRGGNASRERPRSPPQSPNKRASPRKLRGSPVKLSASPTKTTIFTDTPLTLPALHAMSAPMTRPATASSNGSTQSLRELDVNVISAVNTNVITSTPSGSATGRSSAVESGEDDTTRDLGMCKAPAMSLKKHHVNPLSVSQIETRRRGARGLAAEKENVNLSASVGAAGTRRLRNRGSD